MSELPNVINWRRLDANITLSGQPSEEQFREIRTLGVTHVINLGPHSNKGALEDEAGTLDALGMEYTYIPVDFSNPTDEDFEAFCAALERHKGKRVHVHCIYNARVTAFFYRYAKAGLGGSVEDAHAMMDGIWRPGDDWAAFIDSEEAVGQPNRYLGYDY